MMITPLPHTQTEKTIVVLGDSIAHGYGLPKGYAWPQLLHEQLQASYPQYDWRIHNESVPGDTVADAYVRFDAVRAHHPHLLLIALGVNDCRCVHSPIVDRRIAIFHRNERTWWGRHALLRRLGYLLNPLPEAGSQQEPNSQVPMEAFLSILGWMVKQAQTLGALPAFVTMSPLSPDLAEDPHFAPYARYNTAIRDLARDAQAALIEVSHPLPSGSWQVDGVHLSVRGQAEIAQRVFKNFNRPPIATHLGIQTRESNAHMAPSMD